jgi:MFS family permease
VWISGIFTLAAAPTSFASFCVLRSLTGLGLGVLFPLGTTYVNEFAPRRAADVFPLWGAAFGWSLAGAAARLTGVLATRLGLAKSLLHRVSLAAARFGLVLAAAISPGLGARGGGPGRGLNLLLPSGHKAR